MDRYKVGVVVASEMTITAFLTNHIKALCKLYDVTVIVNTSDKEFLTKQNIPANLIQLDIQRKISPLNDIKSFFRLLKIYQINKFDLVYSVTPKAGLLSVLTGFFTATRCRVHTFTGQVWATKAGAPYFFLKLMDKLIARLATHVLADSVSQKQFLIDEKVVPEERINVLANGSISGVDLNRFKPDSQSRRKVRKELGIGDSDTAILFLGRLSLDKGIIDLINAFKMIVEHNKFVKLVIVGPDEAGARERILSTVGPDCENLRMIDFTDHPEHYMNAVDIFCLPSYREGFGSVIIEAAAVGIPAIGSDIYGIRDAIEDNVTGLLFPVHNTQALFKVMQTLVFNKQLRQQFGQAARHRVEQLFSQDYVTRSLIDYCENAINSYRVK